MIDLSLLFPGRIRKDDISLGDPLGQRGLTEERGPGLQVGLEGIVHVMQVMDAKMMSVEEMTD